MIISFSVFERRLASLCLLLCALAVAPSHAVTCQPGTSKAAGDTCAPCPAGSYTDIEDAFLCTRCPIGTIAPSAGQSSCTRCAGEGQTSTDGLTCRACENNVCGPSEAFVPTPAPTAPFSCLKSSASQTPQSTECGPGEIYCFVIESETAKQDTRANERKCTADRALCESGPPGIAGVAAELSTAINWSCCVRADCNTDVAAANALNAGASANANANADADANADAGAAGSGPAGPAEDAAARHRLSVALLATIGSGMVSFF